MGGQHTIPILVLQEFRKRDIVEKIRNFIGCQAGFSDHDLLQEIQKFITVHLDPQGIILYMDVLGNQPSIVHFSAEFKKLFWEELSKGRLPREIVSTLGIDPNILGDSRINGLKTMIGNEVKKGNGFRDLNTYVQGCNGYLSAENRIKYLEMQLAYKNQEIEFLKKIVSLDPEAPE